MQSKVKQGLFWSSIERFSTQGIQFLMTLIISRFVLPEEYGLVAMLGIFIAIANGLVDSGFPNALIQKQNRTDTDFSTVFFFNVIAAIFLYFILCILSRPVSTFYNEPSLELLTKVVGLNLIIISFSGVQNAKLVIDLDFKRISRASVISAIVSGTAGVIMAINNYGVWAIVFQAILNNSIKTILLWYYSKWRPLLVFSNKSFSSLFSFGSKLMLSGMIHTIYLNLYTLIIGKFYSPADVGFYNRANSLAQYPSTNIVGITNRVYFPILCENQKDMNAFSDIFHKYLRMASFIIFPLSIGLACIAAPFITCLLSEKWSGAIIPLQIISIAYLLYPVLLINNQPLQALNHTGMFLKAEIIKKIIAILLLALSVNYGLYILCLSILAYNICDTIIIICFSRRIMATGFRRQIKELSPIFFSSLFMGVIVYIFVMAISLPPLVLLIGGFLLGVVSYILFCKCFKIEELNIIFKEIKKYV